MIGIRNHTRARTARPILDAVHQMADADPNSTGVSLTTERDRNVKLHEHFGYGVIAHKQVSDGIQTGPLQKNHRIASVPTCPSMWLTVMPAR